MSEAVSQVLPGAFDRAGETYTQPLTAKAFPFSASRSKSGQLRALAGVVLLAGGAFLLSQIGSEHGPAVQLSILGAAGLVSGLALLMIAVRDVFGSLVVNESGIAVRPNLMGSSIAWDELHRWQVDFASENYPEANSVLLWTADTPCAMFIPNSWLSHEDRLHVYQLLKSYVPEKEVICR